MTTATTSTDAIVVIDDFGTYNYIIEKNGTGIFRGRVVNVDDEPLVIDVNQVAKDYLFVSVPCLTATTVTQHPDAFGVFTWGSGFNVQDFAIRQDYSGEEWTGTDKELSEPINGHADPRQLLLYSAFLNNEATVNIISE